MNGGRMKSMSDYTEIERPVEPNTCDVDPEQWCEVLAWEEARADRLDEENRKLKEEKEDLKKALGSIKKCSDEISMGNAVHRIKTMQSVINLRHYRHITDEKQGE